MAFPARARPLALAAVAVALAAAVGACDDDGGTTDPDQNGDAVASTTTASDDGGGRAEQETTGTTVAGAADWDGARFDIGVVDRIDRTEDGRTLVVFDRAQVYVGEVARSGTQLEEEPLVYGNTGVELVNDNPRLRTFVFARNGEILRLANAEAVCDFEAEPEAEPEWAELTLDEAVEQSVWEEYQQVSLTFDAEGRVTRVRFSTGC